MKNQESRLKIYSATFLVAFSTLVIEIALSRLLSVISFYHLAFFAVSTAMLGMTAGAVFVYLKPQNFDKQNISYSLAKACIGFSFSIPVSTIIICVIPLSDSFAVMQYFALLLVTVSCSIPFYFSGIIISAVLTKFDLPINKLYASDLIGAAFGCLFVLAGLEFFDAPSLIIFTAIFPVIAAFLYGKSTLSARKLRYCYILIAVILSLSMLNKLTLNGIRPLVVKARFEGPKMFMIEKWNSFSRVTVQHESYELPRYWGPSPIAPTDKLYHQYKMDIDGAAGTVLINFTKMDDIEHLKFDITNIAYYLRPGNSACIIGVGGGRDIQSAILFGHKKITGIDINPVFINLLENRFKDFAGIGGREGVTLVLDEARSHLTRNDEKYDVIEMSLIDTWASVGAGAYTLNENSLYTVEAWKVFLSRLNDNGLFTVSRWYNPSDLGETGRVVSLATGTLLDMGIKEPSKHIAMATTNDVSTLIISKQPFSKSDMEMLENTVNNLQFTLVIRPDSIPLNPTLIKIVSAKSSEELSDNIRDLPFNYTPPTDENPYFFNMLKIKSIPDIKKLMASGGIVHGNLYATFTLIILILCLSVLTIITIVVPLLFGSHKEKMNSELKKVFTAGAIYFSLIGIGFMLLEMSLIQRLSVYLGHPVYALGILLFTIILSTGIGSLVSEKLPISKKPFIYIYPLAALLVIMLLNFILPSIISITITSGMIIKIFIAIAVIFPIGIILGIYFPAGMKLVKDRAGLETPWFWALNGIFGVLSSAIAVFISIFAGISVNFYISALCYGLLIFSTKMLAEKT